MWNLGIWGSDCIVNPEPPPQGKVKQSGGKERGGNQQLQQLLQEIQQLLLSRSIAQRGTGRGEHSEVSHLLQTLVLLKYFQRSYQTQGMGPGGECLRGQLQEEGKACMTEPGCEGASLLQEEDPSEPTVKSPDHQQEQSVGKKYPSKSICIFQQRMYVYVCVYTCVCVY